jgi:hypothetical protein
MDNTLPVASLTVEEAKEAVRAGKTVCADNTSYEVRLHRLRDGREQWLIKFLGSDYCIGMTHADGVTPNSSNFFLKPE